MKLKLYAFILFFLGFTTANSQETQNQLYLSSTTDFGYFCGGRYINASFDAKGVSNSNSENKLFLELFSKGNFQKIQAERVALNGNFGGVFKLPDTLRVGEEYLVRMSSTSPAIVSQSKKFIFGLGKVPFDISFQEKNASISSNEYLTKLKINHSKFTISEYHPSYYTLEINNNLKYNISEFDTSISLFVKDSTEKFKITSIENHCGFAGNSNSEITIQKEKSPNKIYIKIPQSNLYFCPKNFPEIQLVTNFSYVPSELKIEFIQIDNNRTTQINNFKLLGEKLIIDIPATIALNKFYFLKVTHNSGVESNLINFYLNIPNKSIDIFYHVVKDGYQLNFNRQNGEGSSSPYKFKELIINGRDYSSVFNNLQKTFPMPLQDSTLVLQKASDECGILNINENTVNIKPNEYFSLTAKPSKPEFCEGEIAEFDLSDISKELQNIVAVLGFVTFSGNMFNPQTEKFDGKSISHNIRIFDIRLDWSKNKLYVNIPNSLAETIRNAFGEGNYRMSNVDLYVSFHTTTSTKKLITDYISIPLNFAPYIRIIPQSIENYNKGYVKLPLQVITSQKTEILLSDNKKYLIDPEAECPSCMKYYGGNTYLNIQSSTNASISIIKVSNQCSTGKGVGSAFISPSVNVSKIIIEAEKIPSITCMEGDLQIPFKLSEDFDWSRHNLMAEIKFKKNNAPSITYSNFIFESPFILTKKDLDKYKIFADNVEVRFYVYQQPNISSSAISVSLISKPTNFSVNNWNSYMKIINGVEQYSVISVGERFTFQTDGSNSIFTINNKSYVPTNKGPAVSQFSFLMNSPKDTSFVIQSVSNTCGSLMVDKRIKIVYEDLVFKNIYDITDVNFTKSSPCSGSRRVIDYSLEGNLRNRKDSVIVQLARTSKNKDLLFFDVKTEQKSGIIYYTIPDTCWSQYVWRLRFYDNTITSKYQLLNFEVKAKPHISLIGGSREISNHPLTYYEIKYATNLPKSKDFKVIYSNGQTYTQKTFSSVQFLDESQNYIYPNIIRNVPTNFDANYYIREVYNECGVGFAEGEIRIKSNPNISFDVVNYKIDYCAGDSITLKINYSENFPKDTLMGVYIHSIFKRNLNLEIANFKTGINLVSLRLPKDLLTREYYIQIRKKSRKNADYSLFFGYRSSDSSKVANARKEFDTEMKYVKLYAPLRYELSGNYEIFEGQSAFLQLLPLGSNNKDIYVTKDTVSRYYGAYNTLVFTDGTKISSQIVNNTIEVKPLKSTVYQIANAEGMCGVEKIEGVAKVTVMPLQEKRVEIMGFPYYNTITFNKNWRSFYRTQYQMCVGTKDSVDVLVYGSTNDLELQNLNVALSGKDGIDFKNIKTEKFKTIGTLSNAKIIRFFFELPANLSSGYKYKMKITSNNGSFLSNIIEVPISIHEKPTASITGRNSILTGEELNLQVNFTGDSPWFYTVQNEENTRIFSTIPTKEDTLNQFENFIYKPTYSEIYSLKLIPSKSTTYKISEVYNEVCKWGSVTGNPLVVELITSTENSIYKLNIMPNPASESIIIDLLDANSETTVSLLSMEGKKLIEKNAKSAMMEIDIRGFQTGTYLLNIINGSINKTYKVVKN